MLRSPCLSSAGVGLAVALREPFRGYVGVDLRAGETGMAEQFLHHTQIGTSVQQVRSCGVPQSVRAAGPASRFAFELARDQTVDGVAPQPCASPAEKAGGGVGLFGARCERWAPGFEIAAKRARRRGTERHHALLAAFAQHPHGAFTSVNADEIERAEL